MEWIEHYDSASNQYFEIPEFDMTGYADLEQFFKDNQASVQEAVLSSLYHGITLHLKSVPVFAIQDSDAVVLLDDSEYPTKLAACLQYYTQQEEYEICASLVKLSKLIND